MRLWIHELHSKVGGIFNLLQYLICSLILGDVCELMGGSSSNYVSLFESKVCFNLFGCSGEETSSAPSPRKGLSLTCQRRGAERTPGSMVSSTTAAATPVNTAGWTAGAIDAWRKCQWPHWQSDQWLGDKELSGEDLWGQGMGRNSKVGRKHDRRVIS